MMNISERIIVALDFDNAADVKRLVKKLPEASFFKVGLELFSAEGAGIIKYLKEEGKRVFLDLKLNDIPNTVMKTLSLIDKLGVDITDIHISAGPAVLDAIGRARAAAELKTQIFGVTVLTSLDLAQLKKLAFCEPPAALVYRYAALAYGRLEGLICSPFEVAEIKKNYPEFKVITPGIRLNQDAADQKRWASPLFAFENGADYIVAGREITLSSDPAEAFSRIIYSVETKM